ncbi:hypothetical protein [Mesorhizobium sp. Cs1321R2N1]|uniref:hypothetical protein n=1 Tax=Mesorhizobium sp. Cs1321R2N1 TaxID=3015174 RepID=UPI00301E4556
MSNARNTAARPGENSDLPPSSEKKLRLLSLITNLLHKRSGNLAASQTGVIYGDDDFAGSPARLRLLDPLELDYFPHDNEIFQDRMRIPLKQSTAFMPSSPNCTPAWPN